MIRPERVGQLAAPTVAFDFSNCPDSPQGSPVVHPRSVLPVLDPATSLNGASVRQVASWLAKWLVKHPAAVPCDGRGVWFAAEQKAAVNKVLTENGLTEPGCPARIMASCHADGSGSFVWRYTNGGYDFKCVWYNGGRQLHECARFDELNDDWREQREAEVTEAGVTLDEMNHIEASLFDDPSPRAKNQRVDLHNLLAQWSLLNSDTLLPACERNGSYQFPDHTVDVWFSFLQANHCTENIPVPSSIVVYVESATAGRVKLHWEDHVEESRYRDAEGGVVVYGRRRVGTN